MKVGVVGFGYWGPKIVRNLMACTATELAVIADLRQDRLELAERTARGVRLCRTHAELLSDPELDAVVVCTPPETHVAIAIQALEAGKHVLLEKPAGCDSNEVWNFWSCRSEKD